MKNFQTYIIIDDDETNNIICKYMIREAVGKEADIVTFTFSGTAIDFIKSEYIADTGLRKVLFIDLNMPEINGWETLVLLNELEEGVKDQLTVFILSSSIDPCDKRRALEHPLVCDFVEKPLTVSKLKEIFAEKMLEDYSSNR